MFAWEVAVFYYALFSWRACREERPGESRFTIHENSGFGMLLGALVGLSCLEIPLIHLVVRRYSHPAAWILSAISVYGAIWLTGFLRSLTLRPVTLDSSILTLRKGLLWDVQVPLTAIQSVEPAREEDRPARVPGYQLITAGQDPQLDIHLAQPLTAYGPYGLRRSVTRIAVATDAPEEFRKALEAALAAR